MSAQNSSVNPAEPAGRALDLPQTRAAEPAVFRGYFTAAILVTLTAGATWGAWLLWKIGFAKSFTGIGIFEVNAHGHAQIAGWVGLFIMGFAYHALPRFWKVQLPAPVLASVNLALMVAGMVIRTTGMALEGAWSAALPAAMFGGLLEVIAIGLFCAQMIVLWTRSQGPLGPYAAFILTALAFLFVQAVFGLVHTFNTMTAESREQLLWHVATYQAVLRDLQIHGLALFMILGVSLRLLPTIFGTPPTPDRRSWIAWGLLLSAVLMEVTLYLAYRFTGSHAVAGLMLVPWLLLPVGAGLVAWPWRLWRPLAFSLRGGKFVRAAYAWLFISLLMLVLLPVYQVVSGIAFSHAYYGAIRHAITVGFLSMMILGVSATVVPRWRGLDESRLNGLWGPFLLLNTGCFLRVSLQILTDWHDLGFSAVGISGILEVTALTWWGLHLLGLMRSTRAARLDTSFESGALQLGGTTV